MYDKSVRRRRVALALLVACSLLLLTVYFGESAGGGLHSVQRGVGQVVSPIQEGASRALKPVRDLAGWFGDTIQAKGEVGDLKKQNALLRAKAIAGTEAVRQNGELESLMQLDTEAGLKQAAPVNARVIAQSPTVWYSTITIDKGSSAGISVDQPVVTGAGLIGQVSTVGSNFSIVTLITDSDVTVPARISGGSGATGDVQTGSGGPTDLRMEYTNGLRVNRGDNVVTRGTTSDSSRFESAYPPAIPIGVVTRVDDPGTDAQEVHLRPFADLQRLEIVQVLTRRVNGNRG